MNIGYIKSEKHLVGSLRKNQIKLPFPNCRYPARFEKTNDQNFIGTYKDIRGRLFYLGDNREEIEKWETKGDIELILTHDKAAISMRRIWSEKKYYGQQEWAILLFSLEEELLAHMREYSFFNPTDCCSPEAYGSLERTNLGIKALIDYIEDIGRLSIFWLPNINLEEARKYEPTEAKEWGKGIRMNLNDGKEEAISFLKLCYLELRKTLEEAIK